MDKGSFAVIVCAKDIATSDNSRFMPSRLTTFTAKVCSAQDYGQPSDTPAARTLPRALWPRVTRRWVYGAVPPLSKVSRGVKTSPGNNWVQVDCLRR
jgi:hypothetical protein